MIQIEVNRTVPPNSFYYASPKRQVIFRRLAMVAVDGFLILSSFIAAFALRLREQELLFTFLRQHTDLILLALFCGLPILYFSGWYRGLTRYTGSYSIYGMLPRSILMVLVLFLVNYLSLANHPPRSFWILYWFLFTASAIGVRIILRDFLISNILPRPPHHAHHHEPIPTLIYGAGSCGVSLLMGLRNDADIFIVGFMDDDPHLHGRTLHNLKIYNPSQLQWIQQKYSISQVLLAIPSISRLRKRQLVDQLSHLGLRVLSIPSLSQLASGQKQVSDLRPVAIEDLLGREPSTPDPKLISSAVTGKSVLVTGAGGSIGSELCRQVVQQNCNSLILVERNEYALYTIESELRGLIQSIVEPRPNLYPILADVCNSDNMRRLCILHSIDTIFHAAAYKHVPMVEANVCFGLLNNINSTKAVIEAAQQTTTVQRVTLISTDKAVRPTNIMGASKRLCEILFQAAAANAQSDYPIYSMVRFGNVLASSGSVIPRFHAQIAQGGPVTVTHPAITRYFMTIPEAVALVLQATSMAMGGDLFLLDMGEPVRIADLARQMIELSGLRVKENPQSEGDVSIVYTGLRPGEKLYEELLISNQNEQTEHPMIRRAIEPYNPPPDFNHLMEELNSALISWNENLAVAILSKLVSEYQPSTN